MSKRARLFVILVVLVVAGVFLYPTVRWYFIITPAQRQLALSSDLQIRNYAREHSVAGLDTLEKMAQQKSDKPIPAEYGFMVDQAKQNYRLTGKAVPGHWTAAAVLGAFATRQDAYNAFEDHYRKFSIDLKNSRGDILELGLDLSGGMSVLIRADMASLAKRLGKQPTQLQQQQAMRARPSGLLARSQP